MVVEVVKTGEVFRVITLLGKQFTARKLLFATGVKDLMPDIPGFAECWGISVIHCPYCHGYEVHGRPTGILANGDAGFEYARLIRNWTSELTLFTNGANKLTVHQQQKLQARGINIVETPLQEIINTGGQIKYLIFNNGKRHQLGTLYARVPYEQHCPIPVALGLEINDNGLLRVDCFGKTTVTGIYAAGDNCLPMRSVANAVAGGMAAGSSINKELIEDDF